jgi:hypothetical protein
VSAAPRIPRPTWAAFLGAFHHPVERALDRAADFARAYPDEVATVERVRTFLRARMENRKAPIKIDDLVFTFTLVMGALEQELARLGAKAVSKLARTPFRIIFRGTHVAEVDRDQLVAEGVLRAPGAGDGQPRRRRAQAR